MQQLTHTQTDTVEREREGEINKDRGREKQRRRRNGHFCDSALHLGQRGTKAPSHSMLHPTPQHFFFPTLNSFTPNTNTTPPLPTPLIQAEQGMDCVEQALKGSFVPETAVKKEDSWAVSGQTAVAGDDFFVDDLLDLSKDGIFEAEEEPESEQDTKFCSPKAYSPPILAVKKEEQSEKDKDSDPNTSNFSVIDNFPQADDMEDLEWLSHFVEDSSGCSLAYPAGKLAEKPTGNRSEQPKLAVQTKSFATPVQTKARSKRTRTGIRVWSEASSSSSASSSCTLSSPSNSWLIYTSPGLTADSLTPPLKKKRKREAPGGSGGSLQQPRRCSHCLVTKTPQWRAGPHGAKTLCNACGVRYKSGRLLPEYRPACSPTFSSEVHSNNHRKVMEMRRKKVEADLAPPVQSF